MSGSLSVSDTWTSGGSVGIEITGAYKGFGAAVKKEYNWSYAQDYTKVLNYQASVSARKTGLIVGYILGRYEAGAADGFVAWIRTSHKTYMVQQPKSIGWFYAQQ